VAAYEAYQLCGGVAASAACATVAAQVRTCLDASAAEDAKEGGAGAKGAAAPAPAVLLRRKALLVARMADPEALSAACGALLVTYLGVLAAIKLRFARTLALATAIAEGLHPVVQRHALPALDAAVSPELRKWNGPGLSLALKVLVMMAALSMEMALAAMHSALMGGALAARHGLALLVQHGLLKRAAVDDKVVQVLALGLATAGVLSQAGAGFSVPFPLSLLTWPADLAEWALRWQLAVGRTLA
jgi:hypothetical protein